MDQTLIYLALRRYLRFTEPKEAQAHWGRTAGTKVNTVLYSHALNMRPTSAKSGQHSVQAAAPPAQHSQREHGVVVQMQTQAHSWQYFMPSGSTLFAHLISHTLDQILTLKFQPVSTILNLLHAALPCPEHPCRQDGTRVTEMGGTGSFLHSQCRAAPCVTGAELQRDARGERKGRATFSSHSAHSTKPAFPKTTTGENRMTPQSPPS